MPVRFYSLVLLFAVTGCMDINGDWFNMPYNQPKLAPPGSTVTTTTTTTTTTVAAPVVTDTCGDGQGSCTGNDHHTGHSAR